METEYSISNRLKILMEKLGIKQRDFADLLRVSQGTISKYLNNQQEVSVGIAIRLYESHKVNPVWLLTGSGQIFESDQKILEHKYDTVKSEEPLLQKIEITPDEQNLIELFRESGYRGIFNFCKKILK